MASFEEGVLSTGSKLSVVLKRELKFVDELALCLDRETRLIPNWKRLAFELKVDQDVIARLQQYSDFSPTIRLFDHLEAAQPEIVIQQLKQALLDIRRNDLFSLLTTKAGCGDSEKVHEVITSRDIQAPSLRAGLLDEIALALDGTSMVLANWYNLAIKLGVPRKTCWEIGRRSVHNPTKQMFEYFATTRPQMTLKHLRDALQFIGRKDVLNLLLEQTLEDEMLLRDVITPGSELLETMAVALNREDVPAVKNWSHLACKLEVPLDVRQELAGEITGPKGKSPTKEVMRWLVARFPGTTLVDIVKALDRIQRNDAIQIITKQFPDTVDSSMERLDSSLGFSFQGGFSVEVPIFDPTCETLPSRYKRDEGVSPPKQENVKRSGHCGMLPDRTHLVGRDGTCEEIIALLNSNKAAEIMAPPGYGKTSVVIEVGHRMINKGKFVAYVKPRGVTCVEDLGSKIIETLGAIPGEDTIKETLHRIRALEPKSTVLIIENIDNLLHLEDQLNKEDYDKESEVHCAKMRGKFTRADFLRFLTDIGQCPNIHLVLTSRETVDFSVSFPSELIELHPLSNEDSATLFTKRDNTLDNDLVKELVRVCGGIPLIICTVLAILKRENPERFTRRLSQSSPASLIRELNPDFIANEERIDKCLEVCVNRLSQENQDVLVMISTFPNRFTQEQFLAVPFKSSAGLDLEKCMNCLKHSTLVRFDRKSCHFSLHPFIRHFFSLKAQYKKAKSVFIRHYSELAVILCKLFLSRDSKVAIERYRNEKENIREAIAWCGDHHPDLEQETREYSISSFNKSAVFLAKMMRKQEFESLFCKLSHQCRYEMHLYSACLTHIGMKIVLSCTCSPHICPTALYRAKSFLSRANDIQSSLTGTDDSTRAQCLSKLGFCLVREGHYDSGYDYLNQALTLRYKRVAHSAKNKDKVMLAACHNDLAASQLLQRKHMAAIETRRNFVLPDYQSILGDHPFVATTLNWIGSSYQALGDYDNAMKFTSKALEIREQLLGSHQETARSLYDLGVSLSSKKEYESALNFLQKAAALQTEVLDTHDELISTHQALSVVFKCLGREEEAEKELELAGECAKRLDSLEVPLEIFETREEKEWLVTDPVPISSRQEPRSVDSKGKSTS